MPTKKRASRERRYRVVSDPYLFEPHPGLNDGDKLNIREDLGDLNDLKGSIEKKGVRNPLWVEMIPQKIRQKDGPRYWIIAGERRWSCCVALFEEGHEVEIPFIVQDPTNATEAFELMVIENLHRRDLNPMEKARIVSDLEKTGKTVAEIAELVGKTVQWVYGIKRLTNAGPELQSAVAEGKLSQDAAIQIDRDFDRSEQADIVNEVLRGGNKRSAKARIQQLSGKTTKRPGLNQMREVLQALESLDEAEGTVAREEARDAMIAMLNWLLGNKSERVVRSAIRDLFDGQVKTSKLLTAPPHRGRPSRPSKPA